jgi:DNA gyrase/topoisomerase IV subunit B
LRRCTENPSSGHLYLAVPPLYRLAHGGKMFYARDDEHRAEIMAPEFRANANVEVGRFKGLGEMMPAQLKETTMDPKKRTLLKLMLVPEDRADTQRSVERPPARRHVDRRPRQLGGAGKDKLAQNQQLSDLVQALGCGNANGWARSRFGSEGRVHPTGNVQPPPPTHCCVYRGGTVRLGAVKKW